ncbi:PhoH family protein [bacterium]|nr:PhoH family protein [bacterium]
MSRNNKKINSHEEIGEDLFDANWLMDFKIRKPFYFKPKHRDFYNSLHESGTQMSFVDGLAGTAKTYIAVYAALEMLKESLFEKIVYIRSVVESADRSLGSLPGEIDDKFSPYAMPLMEKVTEIAGPGTCNLLLNKGVIEAIPVNFVRGLTFNNTFVIVDEAQNLTKGELTTILTRFGRNSQYIVCGDTKQSDVKQSGFASVLNRFTTDDCSDRGIYTHKFGVDEIVRSKILRFICDKLGS